MMEVVSMLGDIKMSLVQILMQTTAMASADR